MGKKRKILFVCTGNTCRSPMAEAVLRRELKKKEISGFLVHSAGINVVPGSTLSEYSARALKEAKTPVLKSFRPRQLTERMIAEAEVVICMTDSQKRVLAKYPNVTSFLVLCGREIPDPYGHPYEEYKATLRRIKDCLPRLMEKLKIGIPEQE